MKQLQKNDVNNQTRVRGIKKIEKGKGGKVQKGVCVTKVLKLQGGNVNWGWIKAQRVSAGNPIGGENHVLNCLEIRAKSIISYGAKLNKQIRKELGTSLLHKWKIPGLSGTHHLQWTKGQIMIVE